MACHQGNILTIIILYTPASCIFNQVLYQFVPTPVMKLILLLSVAALATALPMSPPEEKYHYQSEPCPLNAQYCIRKMEHRPPGVPPGDCGRGQHTKVNGKYTGKKEHRPPGSCTVNSPPPSTGGAAEVGVAAVQEGVEE
ncbi:hypothetical protein E4T39_01889 [Aureobasidium subglaciale]|nr:hypothetical protein E4T39_01889 [Aureobasidium subglaciale]